MRSISRRRFLAVAGVSTLAGCSTGGIAGEPTEPESRETGAETPAASSPSAFPTRNERLPLPTSPEELRGEVRSGGPGKDGIPSIDDPEFLAPGAVDYLRPGDPVFGVASEGETKAYPQKILVQHEIVNDDLDGTPVSVTYCPLTGTVQGFERGETTFGVSGRLINNNLVMYDRATETWWPQILATSIPGDWNGSPAIESLREFRLVWTTWERWREHNPDTRVLSTDTGHARNYDRDPYGSYNPRGGYYENGNLLFPPLSADDRYDRKTVVMGARTPEGAVAFPKAAVRDQHLVSGAIADTPVLAVHDDRYETAYVYLNPDEATFEYDDGSVVDADGTAHRPDRLPLSRVHTFDAMWFAWAGYYPDTNVHE